MKSGEKIPLLPWTAKTEPYLFFAAGFLAPFFAGFFATFFVVFFTVFFAATVSPLVSWDEIRQ